MKVFRRFNIVLAALVLILLFVSFVGGIVYADKTSGIPKDGFFEIDGYFTNIRQAEKINPDETYPRFEKQFGASPEEAKDFSENPQNYSAYEADVFITNRSSHKLTSVWAVLQYDVVDGGFGYRNTANKDTKPKSRKTVWIDSYITEGVASVQDSFQGRIYFIVNNQALGNDQILRQLQDMSVYIQAGISEKSLNDHLDISRDIYFKAPINYAE